MKMIIGLFSLFIVVNCFASNPTPTSTAAIAGFWKTIDDVSGQPKAIVEIKEEGDHSYSGRIVKMYPQPQEQPTVCVKCKDKRKNQPLIGMVIMEHLIKNKEAHNSWTNGNIIDPHNGKNYRCNIQLLENGQRLMVRGYIGLPLFGRSQIWIKA